MMSGFVSERNRKKPFRRQAMMPFTFQDMIFIALPSKFILSIAFALILLEN